MKIEKFKSIAFVLLLVMIGLLNLGLHTNNAVSESENRNLQTAPVLSIEGFFRDKLTTKLDAFVSDQFMYRDEMIGFASAFGKLRGIPSDVIVETVTGDNMAGGSDNGTSPEQPTGKDVQINYFVYEDRAFRSFKKNENAEKSYAEAISDFAKINPEVSVFSLVSPTQAAFIPDKYEKFTDSPVESIERLKQLFDPVVSFLDVMPLMSSSDATNLFFRTDHHWNGPGAYLGYVAFCQSKGIEPIPLKKFKEIEVAGFVGSFYNMTKNETLSENPDTIFAYAPIYPVTMTRYYMDKEGGVTKANPVAYAVSEKLSGQKPSYGIFLGGDASVVIIETDSDKVNENVLVVKDSYGNAFAPYLSNHYKEVHVVDPRHWIGSLSEYIIEHGISDVIFVNNADINLYDVYDETLRKVF